MADTDRKIVRVEFGESENTDGRTIVTAEFDDKSRGEVFRYYADELNIAASELIGLTEEQARDLYRKKDQSYLRS